MIIIDYIMAKVVSSRIEKIFHCTHPSFSYHIYYWMREIFIRGVQNKLFPHTDSESFLLKQKFYVFTLLCFCNDGQRCSNQRWANVYCLVGTVI